MFSQTTTNGSRFVQGLDIYRLDTTDLPGRVNITPEGAELLWDEENYLEMVYPVKKSELVAKLAEVLAETRINLVSFGVRFARNTMVLIYIPTEGNDIPIYPYGNVDLAYDTFGSYLEITGFKVYKDNLVNKLTEVFGNPEYKVNEIVRLGEDDYFINATHRGTYVSTENMGTDQGDEYFGNLYHRIMELRSGFVFDVNGETRVAHEDQRDTIVKTENLVTRLQELLADGLSIARIRNRHEDYIVVTVRGVREDQPEGFEYTEEEYESNPALVLQRLRDYLLGDSPTTVVDVPQGLDPRWLS